MKAAALLLAMAIGGCTIGPRDIEMVRKIHVCGDGACTVTTTTGRYLLVHGAPRTHNRICQHFSVRPPEKEWRWCVK